MAFLEKGQNPEPQQRGMERVKEQFLASSQPEANAPQDQKWLVRAVENVTVQLRCRQIIRGITMTPNNSATDRRKIEIRPCIRSY